MSDTTDTGAKPLIPFVESFANRLSNYMDPLLRVTVGLMLVPHGFGKLFNPGALEGTAQFFESVGYTPGYMMALAVALLEFVGGLMLAAGLFTRYVALAVVIFMLEAVRFHMGNGFMWTNGGYEYPLFWAITAFILVVKGGGYLSADQAIAKSTGRSL